MWVITGPFDGKERGDLSIRKSKLLKPGKTYKLGRKPGSDLYINNGKVSNQHAELIVGDYSPEDAANPGAVPSFRIRSLRDKEKGLTIKRGGETVIANPAAHRDLRDGDEIEAVSGVLLTVQWRKICCYAPATRGKSSVSVEACAGLGINVVHTFHPEVTHYLSPSFSLTVHMAYSLLHLARIVKSEWLEEAIRLGNLPPTDDMSLEYTFALPQESKYRPAFSPSLPPPLKVFRVWEPNEERVQLFHGYRFLFVGEKGREMPGDLRDLVSGGGGQYEAFAVDSGRAKLHQVLAKGKQRIANNGKALVLVADEGNMIAAVGRDSWQELVDEARSYEAAIVPPDNLVKAVVHVDVSYLTPSTTQESEKAGQPSASPTPEHQPNGGEKGASDVPPSQAEPEQGSSYPPGRRKLTRRATPSASSRPPSPGPSAPPKEPTPEVEQAPPRKRLLTRRAGGRTPLVSIGDDSVDSDSVASIAAVDAVKPPSTRRAASPSDNNSTRVSQTQTRSSRLKRRAGTAINPLSILEDPEEPDPGKEPPLKRFKALFDESDPSNLAQFGLSGALDIQTGAVNHEEIYSMLQSQTQTDTTQSTAAGRKTGTQAAGRLAAVAEEEEENSMTSVTKSSTSRGQLQSQAAAATSVTESGPSTKGASQIPMTNSIKQPKKSGAAPGQPDTDEGFLKALASKKKGKKHEDTFDREFNNLRISKPDLQQQQEHRDEEREWEMMDDFGDYGVRGNFMVVVEMEVPEHRTRAARRGEGRLEWQGKPDFKKFKHKPAPGRRSKVELVVSEENQYASYWRGSQTQSQSQPLVGVSPPSPGPRVADQAQARSQAVKPRNRIRTPMPAEDGDDNVAPLPLSAKAQPLFLPESQESQMVDIEPTPDAAPASQEDEAPPTLRSVEEPTPVAPPAKPASRKRKTPAAVIIDDDSDDGVAFKGFRSRKKTKVK